MNRCPSWFTHGEIVQAGTPTEIYEFPGSKFVADFIGSVNMFEGKLVEDEPNYVRIASPELGGTIYVSHGISAPPEAVVWAAVRPEKIFMSTAAPEGHSGTRPQRPAQNLKRARWPQINCSNSPPPHCAMATSSACIRSPSGAGADAR